MGYNSIIVMLGAGGIGAACGALGTFLVLRRRVLVVDAISHASLPGIGIAFLVMAAMGGDGRFLPGLLIGGGITAFCALMMIEWLTRRTKLPEDSTIGAVLASMFGFGVVILTIVQSAGLGKPAGVSGFLLGSTATMQAAEAALIGWSGLALGIFLFALRRPFTFIAFDQRYAAMCGFKARVYDRILLLFALFITVLGLKVAGLVLIIALMIIPPLAARFWVRRVETMALLAACFGALSGMGGAWLSALLPRLPTGSIIVLVAFILFVLSAFWHHIVRGQR